MSDWDSHLRPKKQHCSRLLLIWSLLLIIEVKFESFVSHSFVLPHLYGAVWLATGMATHFCLKCSVGIALATLIFGLKMVSGSFFRDKTPTLLATTSTFNQDSFFLFCPFFYSELESAFEIQIMKVKWISVLLLKAYFYHSICLLDLLLFLFFDVVWR